MHAFSCWTLFICSNWNLTQRITISLSGDGYGLINVDTFTSGSFYSSATSSGSMMNTQNLNAVKLGSIPITSSLISGHSNLHSMHQTAHQKSQAINSLKNLKFQSSLTSRDGHVHTQQHYQQRPQQYHQSERYVPQQFQPKVQSQQPQHLVNSDAFSQSQLSSNLDNQIKSEPAAEPNKEVINSQLSEKFHVSEMQNQFQHISSKDCSKVAQNLPFSSGPHDSPSSTPQMSQQMLHSHQLVSESQNNLSCLSVGSQSKSILLNQWPQSQDENHIPQGMSHEQHLPMNFQQRISGQDEAQCNNLSSDGSIIGQAIACRSSTELLDSGSAIKKEHRNQQRWLLFLFHARRCSAPEGRCQERHCSSVQKLCNHIDRCTTPLCSYPRCHHTRKLLHHFIKCKNPHCPVCVLVRKYRLAFQLKPQIRSDPESCLPIALNGSCESYNVGDPSPKLISKSPLVIETLEDLPSLKRMKTEQCTQSINPECDNSASSLLPNCESQDLKDTQCQAYPCGDISISTKSEFTEVKAEVMVHAIHENLSETKMDKDNARDKRPIGKPVTYNEPANIARPENIKTEKETGQENVTQPSEHAAAGTKSGKPKIKAVSLTELFTPEQVREHITGLRQWVGQVRLFYSCAIFFPRKDYFIAINLIVA